jgi:DNA-binding MarR family transcriptional regulator
MLIYMAFGLPMERMSSKQDLARISRVLHSVAIHLLRDVRVQDSSLGIGPAQLSALSVIVFGGPRSLRELAEAEQVRPPTMSRIVEALVKQELVKREINSSDRRSIAISPTQKGIQIMKEGRDLREKRLLELLKPLRLDEIEEIGRAAEALARILQA